MPNEAESAESEADRRDNVRSSLEGMRDALTKMLDTYKPSRDPKPPNITAEEWISTLQKQLTIINDMLKLSTHNSLMPSSGIRLLGVPKVQLSRAKLVQLTDDPF